MRNAGAGHRIGLAWRGVAGEWGGGVPGKAGQWASAAAFPMTRLGAMGWTVRGAGAAATGATRVGACSVGGAGAALKIGKSRRMRTSEGRGRRGIGLGRERDSDGEQENAGALACVEHGEV
jgi:hypothetical protein